VPTTTKLLSSILPSIHPESDLFRHSIRRYGIVRRRRVRFAQFPFGTRSGFIDKKPYHRLAMAFSPGAGRQIQLDFEAMVPRVEVKAITSPMSRSIFIS
jgi:hypothetical protein